MVLCPRSRSRVGILPGAAGYEPAELCSALVTTALPQHCRRAHVPGRRRARGSAQARRRETHGWATEATPLLNPCHKERIQNTTIAPKIKRLLLHRVVPLCENRKPPIGRERQISAVHQKSVLLSSRLSAQTARQPAAAGTAPALTPIFQHS